MRPAVDLRSLALFRILLAATVCVDLLIRAGDLGELYSDRGVLPRELLLLLEPSGNYFSFHLMNGAAWFQALIFTAAFTSAVLVLVGHRARTFCFVLWLLTISLQFRNPYLTEGYDVYVRQLLFWASFTPLSATWSLDAWRSRSEDTRSKRYASLPVAALLLQVLILYLFAGLHKLQNPVWLSGDALYHALAAPDFYARSFSAALTFSPFLLQLGTYLTLLIEVGFPLLLVIRPNSRMIRSAFVISMAALHVGILVSMDVGLFSIVSLAALVSFLPAELWTAVEPHRRRFVEESSRVLQGLFGERAWMASAAWVSRPVAIAPPTERARWRIVAERVLVVAIMSYVVFVNISNLLPQRVPSLPSEVKNVAKFFRFNQKFALFAYVSDDPIYEQLHAVGRVADGSSRNLADGSVYDRKRVAEGYRASFPSHRWVKWFIKMRRLEKLHLPYAQYQCRKSAPGARAPGLSAVELRLVSVDMTRVPSSEQLLLSYDCDREHR